MDQDIQDIRTSLRTKQQTPWQWWKYPWLGELERGVGGCEKRSWTQIHGSDKRMGSATSAYEELHSQNSKAVGVPSRRREGGRRRREEKQEQTGRNGRER